MDKITTETLKQFNKNSRKIRTLGNQHIVILLGYCPGHAFIYQKWKDRNPTLKFSGNYFNDKIDEKSKILVAEMSTFDSSIMISSNKAGNAALSKGIIFGTNGHNELPGGCILMYGKPERKKFHLNIIKNSHHDVQNYPLTVVDSDEIMTAKAILGAVLLNNGFKFNWNHFIEEIFDCKVYIRNTNGGYDYETA